MQTIPTKVTKTLSPALPTYEKYYTKHPPTLRKHHWTPSNIKNISLSQYLTTPTTLHYQYFLHRENATLSQSLPSRRHYTISPRKRFTVFVSTNNTYLYLFQHLCYENTTLSQALTSLQQYIISIPTNITKNTTLLLPYPISWYLWDLFSCQSYYHSHCFFVLHFSL
jgi:hypothetical protein